MADMDRHGIQKSNLCGMRNVASGPPYYQTLATQTQRSLAPALSKHKKVSREGTFDSKMAESRALMANPEGYVTECSESHQRTDDVYRQGCLLLLVQTEYQPE